jgi:hypothetical protein
VANSLAVSTPFRTVVSIVVMGISGGRSGAVPEATIDGRDRFDPILGDDLEKSCRDPGAR